MNALIEAAERSRRGRLRTFVSGPESEPVRLFDRSRRCSPGDWFGEHAGKWLIAASLAATREQDDELAARVASVADWLCDQQDSNGYLGTYDPGSPARFDRMRAPDERTWDLWNAACTMLGLTVASQQFEQSRWMDAANGIASLIHVEIFDRGMDPVLLGNHAGLSSCAILEPLARLASLGSTQAAQSATWIVDRLESAEAIRLVSAPLEGVDAARIGTGKIYQLCWVYHGLALLSEPAGDSRMLRAAERFWANVAEHHLTPLGGPWGGIATHKEVFNPQGYFNPCGLVETCSSLAWLRLSLELDRLTGGQDGACPSKYRRAAEVTAMNQLLGAAFPNGLDWSYFSMPNGPRSVAYDWACCKSSGAWGLEEAARLLTPDTDMAGDVQVLRAAEHLAHHEHDVFHREFFALQRGATVYAMEPLDGFQFEATIRLPVLFPGSYVHVDGDRLVVTAPGHEPIWFTPYRDAGLQRPDRWRITWVPVVWQ